MASSRRHPPQLQLAFSTPPHQSFKRSFQQFGLDVDSPQSAGGSSSDATQPNSNFGASASGSASDGNERNKRARSEARSVEYGETSGPSSAVEDERYRPMIPEFTEDTMEGIEVGSSQSSSSSASGSNSSANASTINSSIESSFERSLFAPRAYEEPRDAVVEPQGVPVARQTNRRRLLDLPSFRGVRASPRDRPTLPAFDEVNRPLLHPALRARPSSPVMTAPATYTTPASLSGPTAPPSTNPVESWSNVLERARAFHESLEPLRRTPAGPPTMPSAGSRIQQAGPRPRARELHPDQLVRFGDDADSDGEDLDLPPVFSEFSGRERLLSVGNPAIPMMPTSPDVGLSAFSVAPLEPTSRPGPGTATSMLRRRLETATAQQAEHDSPPRRVPRLQTRDQLFANQSSTPAPALYPSSMWSRGVLQDSRESVDPGLNSLHDNVTSLMDEMHSPSVARMEQQQQRADVSVSRETMYFERPYQPSQVNVADHPFLRSDPAQRQVRRRPRTLLNRNSPPPRPLSTTQSQMEPAAALRRLLQTVNQPPPPEPRFESIFSSGEIQRERVLPSPVTTSGRQSVRPAPTPVETDRERFTRYTSDLSVAEDRETARTRALPVRPPEMRSSSRLLRRPSLLNPAREDTSMRTLPDLFSVYDEGVEREADHLARLSTLPGIRSQAESHSPTFEDEMVPWGRTLRADDISSFADAAPRTRPYYFYGGNTRGREGEMPRRDERDVLPRPITALTSMREQDRMLGFQSTPTSPVDAPNPWEPRNARSMVPDFDFDTSSRSTSRVASDSSASTRRTQADTVLRQRRLGLMTERASSQMSRIAPSPQERSFEQAWANSSVSYDMETSFGGQSANSSARNEEPSSHMDHRLLRLMGPRRSSGDGQPTTQVPRLPVNEPDYNGWLPAPRSPTRQVEIAAPELSPFSNEPSFDIPPSPPLPSGWEIRMRQRQQESLWGRGRVEDSRPSLSSLPQFQSQNDASPESILEAQEYFEQMRHYHEHVPTNSNRDRERHQVHRLLGRRNPLQPSTRREGTPAAAPSSSQVYRPSRVASNHFEGSRQVVGERAPATASVSTADLNVHVERSNSNSWGEIDGYDGRHTLSSLGHSLRRRQQASLNPPTPSPDVSGGLREGGSGSVPGMTVFSTQSRLAGNTTTGSAAARRRDARRPRLPSLNMGRSPFTDEPLPSRNLSTARRVQRRAARNMGDFVRDEDFDSSYEGLLALAATLGEVKPRSTPSHMIDALPSGTFKEWQKADSDARCPICLDDYADSDAVLKCEPCSHWCHKECLQQWLHTARTCPVCRGKVHPAKCPPSPPIAGPSNSSNNSNNNNNDPDEDSSDDDDLSWGSPRIPSGANIAMFQLLQNTYLRR